MHQYLGGRVLGLPSTLRIDYEATRSIGSKAIVMREGPKSTKAQRYTDPNATWKDRSHEYKRITRAKAEELARTLGLQNEDPSYISLDIRKAPNKDDIEGNYDDASESSDEDMGADGYKAVDYRDIHGKSVHKDQDDDLLQTTSDQEEEGAESSLDVLTRRRSALDADLRKNPKQPQKWLEFIAVADDIESITNRRSAAAVSAHSTSHSEVKLSIFDRALQHNPTDERLLLAYMNCYRHVYEPVKVLTKWDELLQSEQIRFAWPGLWIEYLDFRQRHFASFSVNSFVAVLRDALDNLNSIATRLKKDINIDEKSDLEARNRLVQTEAVIVHVFARAWTFLKQAGYTEWAHAIVQGQAEFILNMPEQLKNASLSSKIGTLAQFWESELPRFGEKSAMGWAHYMTEEGEVVPTDELLNSLRQSLEAETMDDLFKSFDEGDEQRSLLNQWAKTEKKINAAGWFPMRVTDPLPDELQNDPYGIIMFEDIQPFIVEVRTAEGRMQFVDSMFHFLGLPMSLVSGANSSQHHREMTSATMPLSEMRASSYNPFNSDSLLLNIGMDGAYASVDLNPGLDRFFPPVIAREKAIELVLKEIESADRVAEDHTWNGVWNLPLRVYTQGPDTVFGRRVDQEGMDIRYPWASISSHAEVKQCKDHFVRNSLQQLVEVTPVEDNYRYQILLYYLLYETLSSPPTVDKKEKSSDGKKLVEKYPQFFLTNLELWNGYAQSEKLVGRIKQARGVYSKALKVCQSLPAEHRTRIPILHRFFAELEWEQGRPAVALEILILFAEDNPGGVSGIPKTNDMGPPSPTRVVKARQFYAQKVAQLNLARPAPGKSHSSVDYRWFDLALDLIVCYAWFQYLSSPIAAGTEVEAGIKVFEAAIEELDFRNPDAEVRVASNLQEQSILNESVGMRSILVPRHLSASTGATLSSPTKGNAVLKKKICTGPEAEMLWTQLAKMVYFHSIGKGESAPESQRHSGGFQPKALRRIVHSGLERFPNSSIFQSLYFWTESKQRVYGRVRTWVNDCVTQGCAVNGGLVGEGAGYPAANKSVLWIFGLYYELWHRETYNVHTVRTMLESALESSKATSLNSSPNLWMIYIELELREYARLKDLARASSSQHAISSASKATNRADTNRKKQHSAATDAAAEAGRRVKRLLMRALADCPWYKDLYLLAFGPRMRALYSAADLEQLYETMLEKEIRVRYELPERDIEKDDSEEESEIDSSDASQSDHRDT
ncbi:hypothetical protein BGZ94_001464 [Podila epigama]|nr:hypothetical protein BGZ94_001464 [Podila epigama]